MPDQVVQNRNLLVRRAIQGAPVEVCGFVMLDGSIVEIPNSSIDPIRNFHMARHHLIDRVPDPSKIYAIWHSHPNGNCEPSKNDMLAVETGYIKQHWVYLIVTPNGVFEHSFLKEDNGISIATITR